MATTSTTTAAADDDSHRVVDLRLLSQSELYSLSLSSDSSFDRDDVVIPKINRSVFNESAGSRKQTYSRLRLASAESSTTTTLHRRTPHLRSSLTTSSNNINDPEQAENSLIIRMLKHLCKSNPNFHDLAEIEGENNVNSVLPEFLNNENLVIKRKRGRPRKHENVVFLRPPTAKRIRNNTVKKVVVFDHERDREIVNDRGVVVNLLTLAGIEDPYGTEIRRRTVGMCTEDELLGFLRGLNGQWGSRRKKRRVVDAVEFGDVLPKGWRLSLCIKKKEGRVWLFCRRYISPSGQQFESCKEISTYLISVIGEQNLDKPNHININNCGDVAMKEASVNAADLVLQEDSKRDDSNSINNPSSSSSCQLNNPSSSSPPPTNHEEQVTMDIEDAMEVQMGDLPASKPSLAPASEPSLAPSSEPSLAPASEPSLAPASEPSLAPSSEPSLAPASEPSSLASVSASEKPEPGSGLDYETNSGKLTDTEELVHDLNIASHSIHDGQIDKNMYIEESNDKLGNGCPINDEIIKPDQVSDIAVSQSELLVDESNRKPETCGEDRVDDKMECNLDQGISSESFLSQFPTKEPGDDCENEISNQGEVAYVDSVYEKSPNEQMGNNGKDIAGFGVVDHAVSETSCPKSISDEKGFHLVSEKEKEVGESSFGLFLDRFGLDKDGATIAKKLPIKPTPLIDSAKAVNTETTINAHGTYNNINKLSSGLTSSKLDAQFDVRRNTFVDYGASGIENVNTFGDENEFRNHPSLTSWQEEECENVTKVSSSKPEEPKLDDFQIFRNEAKRNESAASLDGLNRDVLDFNTKSNLEFCSLVPSETEQAFSFQDDVTCLYDRAMEECKQESSERGLLNHFSIADTSDDIFENKMYSTPLDGIKFDDERDISSNELSLAFGNPHALYSEAIRVDQKKDLVSCSKIDDAFDVHTSLSMVNNSMMVENLKAGSGSVGGLFNLSCDDKSSGFQNNGGNAVFNKFSTGFGSQSHGQSHEVVPSGMWKTSGNGNQLQSGLSTSSHSQIQSPSSFHSFNIMSEKAADGEFRLDERYNEGFGVSGMRSSRPEPVEFSFLTGRSQHNPLQGDSRVFSYNSGMEQQFDSSSFWLGKNNGMMPNTGGGGRNQITTSVCAWCRNEFHLQPLHSGAQDGIGSLCPSCTAGMSAHVNLL